MATSSKVAALRRAGPQQTTGTASRSRRALAPPRRHASPLVVPAFPAVILAMVIAAALGAEGRIAWNGEVAQVRCATRSGTIDVWLERDREHVASPRVTLPLAWPRYRRDSA